MKKNYKSAEEAFSEMRQLLEAMESCPKPHDFPKGEWEHDRVKCTKCGVEIDALCAMWYRSGLKHATARIREKKEILESITEEEWEELRKDYEHVE